MDNRSTTYVSQQLAYTGFVLTSVYHAHKLRPDLSDSAQAAIGLLGISKEFFKIRLFNVRHFNAKFNNGLDCEVWSRSSTRLAERIEELTGWQVSSIDEIFETDRVPTRSKSELAQEQAKADHITKLKKLAEQEPPAHDCSNRREILAARDELRSLEMKND